jgi:ribonuclease HI
MSKPKLDAYAKAFKREQWVSVTWEMKGKVDDVTWHGKVDTEAAVKNGRVDKPPRIMFEEHGSHMFPMLIQGSAGIIECRISRTHAIGELPPFTDSTKPVLAVPTMTIYSDGAEVKGTIEAAAAITVHNGADDKPVSEHARYLPGATNIVGEWIGLIAALRYAEKHPTASTLIIIDLDIMLRQLDGRARCNDAQVKRLCTTAVEILKKVEKYTTVAHMLRAHDNKADKVAVQARTTKKSCGEATLFDVDYQPHTTGRKGRIAPLPIVDEVSIGEWADSYSTWQKFLQVRRWRTRTSCPPAAQPGWAHLVKQTLQGVLHATTEKERSQRLITFMLLPSIFLPCGKPTTRVERQVGRGQAFAARDVEPRTDAEYHKPRTAEERLAKAVTKLAADRKIKNAVKILMHDAVSGGDRPFDEKATLLRKKFPSRIDAVSPLEVHESTIPFESEVVTHVLRSMSRNAATCIDAWNRDLVLQAMTIDATIADDLGYLCARVNDGLFGGTEMDVIRLGRLVALPRDDGGVRPVVLSSFLAKLTGACVLHRARMSCSSMQYAVNCKRGAERIVHLVRREYEGGRAILRLDVSNAFNATPRAQVAATLRDAPAEVKAYFNNIYVPKAKLCLYGPRGEFDIVESEEGVRQGDAMSAMMFCKVVDKACIKLSHEFPDAGVWSYMDDITIACNRDQLDAVSKAAVAHIQDLGLKVNIEKSACAMRHPDPDSAMSEIQLLRAEDPFVMLGACVNEHGDALMEKMAAKMTAFFTKLFSCELHPQLQWTILRLCGSPKLLYAASTMPPEMTAPLMKHFGDMLHKAANKIVDVEIPKEHLHNVAGAGFPDYVEAAPVLYRQSREMSEGGSVDAIPNMLTSPNPLIKSAEGYAQPDAAYLFFTEMTRYARFTPKMFQIALAIRLHSLPRYLARECLPYTCACRGSGTITDAPAFIDHVFRCPHMSELKFNHRHDGVVHAIAAVARSYAIPVTVEPKMYHYHTGEANRPDLVLHQAVPIATDVTIVCSDTADRSEVKHAAQAKRTKHEDAVKRFGHEFIPFAMDVHGYRDPSCFQFADAVSRQLPIHLQRSFRFDLAHAVSRALAVKRAETILGVAIGRRY